MASQFLNNEISTRAGDPVLTHFPQAVPEIPVSNVDKAAEYDVNVLGFSFDWGNCACSTISTGK